MVDLILILNGLLVYIVQVALVLVPSYFLIKALIKFAIKEYKQSNNQN